MGLNYDEMSRKTEKKIVEFLSENGPSFFGEVIKELRLSNAKGIENILRLHSKGIIRRTNSPVQYELDGSRL